MNLEIKLLSPSAKVPTRGSPLSAGLDLYCDLKQFAQKPHATLDRKTGEVFLWLYPGQRETFHTNIAVAISEGYYGRIAPRSGLAVKFGLDVLAGVVDADYRGEVGVILLNNGTQPVRIMHNDRVAQLIIEKIEMPKPVVVSELSITSRGAGGLGSTGA